MKTTTSTKAREEDADDAPDAPDAPNAGDAPDAPDAPEPTKRRRHPRFSVDVQAAVSVDSRSFEARTRDVSRAGLCLVALQSIPRNSEIAIELVLTFGEDGMSEPLHVRGEVVWCTLLFGAYQIGVKFVKVDDEQARYLNMFLGFLDGSLSPGDPTDDVDTQDGNRDPDDPFAV